MITMVASDIYAVGPITVNGRDFPVTFNSRSGTFTADVDGRGVGAQVWDDLRQRVTVEERRTRVKVAVQFVDPESGRKGTATGLHASTRRPLIRWADGGTAQDDVREPLRPDTDTAKLAELVAASRSAERALRNFRSEHRLPDGYQLSGIVEAAIKAKVDEQDRESALMDDEQG
jgi:hypothetical protein